jgi:hypothetical protein
MVEVVPETSPLELPAAILDRDAESLTAPLGDLLNVEPAGLAAARDTCGAELMELAMRDAGGFEWALDDPPTRRAELAQVCARASKRPRVLLNEEG